MLVVVSGVLHAFMREIRVLVEFFERGIADDAAVD